jgi:hypothetical protein
MYPRDCRLVFRRGQQA